MHRNYHSTWRFMGSYDKSPNMGYNYSYPTYDYPITFKYFLGNPRTEYDEILRPLLLKHLSCRFHGVAKGMAWALRILSHLEVSGFRIYMVSEGLRFRVSIVQSSRFLFALAFSPFSGSRGHGFTALPSMASKLWKISLRASRG